MICLECGRQVRSINYQHLRSCSGLTPAGYRESYPGASLMDADVRASISRPMDANPRWKGRSGRRCVNCRATLSRKTRGELCKGCRDRSGEKNPFHAKRHAPETRDRMKAAATKRAPESYVGSRNPNPRLLSLRRREEWARRTPEEKERHLTAFIVAGQRTNKKNRGTRIEVKIAEILDALGIEYRQNVQIGRFNVDSSLGIPSSSVLVISGTAIRRPGHLIITTARSTCLPKTSGPVMPPGNVRWSAKVFGSLRCGNPTSDPTRAPWSRSFENC